MATINLYEDNSGGLYLEREADGYASGRRVATGLEYSDALFGVDADALSRDADAWDVGVIGLDPDLTAQCLDPEGGSDIDSAMDRELSGLMLLADWVDGAVTVYRQLGSTGSFYIFGRRDCQGKPLSDYSLDALTALATYASQHAIRQSQRYPTSAVATTLGIAATTVRQHANKLGVGQRLGRDLYFTAADLAIIRERVGKVGRPRNDA